MATPRLDVREINEGRGCVWEVRTGWEERMTHEEATKLHEDVKEVCGDLCNGEEFVSVHASCREVCWRCIGKDAALEVMGCVAEKLKGLSGRIKHERDVVKAEKLWARYINSGESLETELVKALQRVEELEYRLEQLQGETDQTGGC